MKKSFFFIVSLFVILFSSCQNFMDAGNIQKEIEDIITEANAKSIKLVISQDTTMGTFLSSGEKECKLGYSINVQFNLKKEAYIFKGLKAVSTSGADISRKDCVEFKIKDRDDEKGIYKVEIKVVKDVDDLMIMPDCILVPGVVKENCFPSFDAGGWEQDSTIKIAFNKPVETLDSFELSITDTSGLDMSSYYEQPRFSEDNMTILIPAVKTKNNKEKILDPDGTIPTKDLIVKFDLSYVQDEDGNTGSGLFEYKYRLKKQCDTDTPTLDSVSIYSTSDTTNKYYKELSSKTFSDWTTKEDFTSHHIAGSVYIVVEASDEGTGIYGICVKEKLIKYSDGTAAPANGTAITYNQQVTLDNESGKYSCNYEINNVADGIIELEIFAQDYSDNLSTTSKKYYVLKDTTIDSSLLRFNEEITSLDLTTVDNWFAHSPVIEGDTQQVLITLPENSKDEYFGNYTSDFKMEAYWGYSKKNISEPISINNNEFSFTRDVTKPVYIKLKCTDDVGNTKEIIKYMDPRAEIEDFNFSEEFIFDTDILIKNFESMRNLNNKDPSITSCKKLLFDFNGSEKCMLPDPLNTMETPLTGDQPNAWLYNVLLVNNNQVPLNVPVRIYVATFCGDFLSPRSNEYVQFMISKWDNTSNMQYAEFADGHFPELVSSSTAGGTTNPEVEQTEEGPHLKPVDNIFYKAGSAAGCNISYPRPEYDLEGNIKLYKNKNGNFELSYYLIPNSSNKFRNGISYSLEEVETYYKKYEHKREYDIVFGQDILCLPYGNLKEGLYDVCVVLKDNQTDNPLYALLTLSVINRVIGHVDYQLEPVASFFPADSKDHIWFEWTDNNCLFWNKYVEGGNQNESSLPDEINFIPNSWNRITGYRDIDPQNGSTLNAGFFYTEYFYNGYNTQCNNKNCVQGLNGLQIFCDNSVFAHTMYSPDLLTESTETEDALYIWESKGVETGAIIRSENFTYDQDKYELIPTGWYYTTIFHFADGTVVMTDIKQK